VRIALVHQYFLAPSEPGISRFNEMARVWVASGHELTVIAGTVSLSTGQTHPETRGRLLTRLSDGPVTVWRCFVPSVYSKGYLGRRLAYAVFTVSASVAALRTPSADVVIATSPPLFVVIPGWLKAKLSGRRTPWVFEVRDLWPESAVTTGVVGARAPLTRFLYWLERRACASAAFVVTLTPAIADDMIRRRLAPPERVRCIPNGADLRIFAPGSRDNAFRREFGWGDRIVAMYSGAHGRANDLGQLLDAADALRDRTDIVIALVGDGQQRGTLEAEARRRALPNVVFCGPQPKERMSECVNAADIGLAVLQRNPTFHTVYPNKIFDYMACARPIVLAIDGVARELVCDRSRSGVFAQPGDGRAIASAIRRLADVPELRRELGANGRRWVQQNESRDALAQRYLELMEELVSRK
jgi:glycosyltransferase involved in cell wall biosynthesis